ncbi:EGF and laminin G domain-containing protein isoform X5 [Cryptotermes secundus]|uniref:EGF and laminin G domain-containing protein isoform X5 n=1 Tax=Cryptotermes secundus TaxID=105785 RepID=UPI000CD7B91B|nr:EGF and laminin G domain-containing protein isoform X5 [Cryptotermes secundus]
MRVHNVVEFFTFFIVAACAHPHSPQQPLNASKQEPDRCEVAPLLGPCKINTYKWYYNSSLGQCFTFVYGGCNMSDADNKFSSEQECLHYCGGAGYTLPPYLQPREYEESTGKPESVTEKHKDHKTTLQPQITYVPTVPTPPPVPLDKRGEELTFEETGHHKVFMFAKSNTFIQLDGNRIPTFQLRLCREISFQFRTKLPHGLLVYHSVKGRPEGLDPYALYVIVEKGQLKVVHVFGKHSTSITVGAGLNRDKWHNVTVTIDVHRARLIAKVDSKQAETHILGLHTSTNYGVSTDLPSIVLIGGLSPEEKLHGVKYIIESFVGCIKQMVLKAGKAASDLLHINPLIATKHENVVEGCIDKCDTKENLCFVGSHCVNHYYSLTCDCFGRKYEGEQCDIYTGTVLTLRGSSYISYRVYDWKDRVHSSINRISFFFKTRFDDSALFYASGEPYLRHYIAVSLLNDTLHVEIDFGDGAVSTTIGKGLLSNYWNNFTIAHHKNVISVHLNYDSEELELPGPNYHLYIDPEIYIGGGPELHKKKGLMSYNNFAGCLKYAFFNDISILYELKKGNPKVHYIGVLEPEIYETDVEVIPITFPFPSSYIWWPNQQADNFTLKFSFKSNRSMAVLATSSVRTATGNGYWEVRAVNDEIRFELVPDEAKNVTHLTTVKFNYRSSWHVVNLNYTKGKLTLTVDYKYKTAQLLGLKFQLGDRVIIGSGGKLNQGLVGCIREVEVNGEALEPRYVVSSDYKQGQVSLDNCQLVDPCKRPNACEHGGKCSVKDDRVTCDCEGTGYIGNNCHFAEHRKTCEELALLGYTKPDVYLIDIDGNGRFPPAHVKCEFQSLEDSTKTIVEHNLPSQVDVRSSTDKDFSFNITYREFTAEMMQELISHSLYCSQKIKYDCYKAPLELHSATWFVSSMESDIVDYLGNVKRGACPCAVNKTCVDPTRSCNCDISEPKWHSDEGYYVTPESLGITQMVFLQQKDLDADAQGRITLGPLECVETNTQKYVVTFTSSQSYIEVPGWRKGDISFSFRTTGEKAILLYQPPIRPNHPSFMVALTNDFQLTFNFTLNTGHQRVMEIKSGRQLNSGEWQKIWIDYNEHHVRFMINTDYQMVDLLPEEEFGPFEGSMFIGGATEDLLGSSSVQQGLIGCFRGLVVNGEILDIYSYMSVHLSEIIKDCKPSCDPSPCKNGAKCKELWSTFQCVCKNPWAHVGTYCETNINIEGLTFLSRESFLKKNYLARTADNERHIMLQLLSENILLNLRTYDHSSLLLYANDHLNNFVQLHIQDGKYIVFTFNSGSKIHNITVEYSGVSDGQSVQVAVIRNDRETVLHVNNQNGSIPETVQLLTNYSNKPWINPDKEVLAPQRPPAPPTEYFQLNLGGYDPDNLIAGSSAPTLQGYVGCMRGLKIGDHLFDLSLQVTNESKPDMIAGCKMKCDDQPCKNQGICIEDFQKQEVTCNCERTSFYGDFCDEEKGADFSGDTMLRRKFILNGPVDQIKVHLAFSSTDIRQKNTGLLLLQTENKQSYYLLVALTSEGELIFEEDGEGSASGARVSDRNFLNGARHSVYYQREGDSAMLLIDREPVPLMPISFLSRSDVPEGDQGTNEVQVGGLNTSDPRFAVYKNYKGCLSNVYVEVNSDVMKPLEEYMLFTKTGSEKVNVTNALGLRSAQCAFFDVSHKPKPSPSLNISLGTDKTWILDSPIKIPYESLWSDVSSEEDGPTRVLFLVMCGMFVLIVLCSLCEVYRSYRKHKRRREEEADASLMWRHGGQPAKYQEPLLNSSIKMTAYKNIPQQDIKLKPSLHSSEQKPNLKNDYRQIPNPASANGRPDAGKPNSVNNKHSSGANPDQELNWDPMAEKTELLQDSLEDIPESVHNSPDEEQGSEREDDNVPNKPGQEHIVNGVTTQGQNNTSALFPTIPEGRRLLRW